MIITGCSNKWIPALSRGLLVAAFTLLVGTSHAFSLLGPFETWQTQSLGYNYSGEDIGGPKQLGEEYRWNIPEVTVGVDRAFYDFFGPEGIRAVKEAFQILNAVPAASEINLDAFPLDSRRIDFRAAATNLLNLKTAILSLSLAQVGLADPERYVWTLRERMASYNPPITNYLVVQRNFDPESFVPSSYVNDVRYSYSIFEYEQPFFFADAFDQPIRVLPEQVLPYSSVAGLLSPQLEAGVWVTNLTRDDVGGLNYLLRKENVNFEPLPAGVWLDQPFEPTTPPVVEALRPGIEKVILPL